MRRYFIIFIFLFNCSFNQSNQGVVNINVAQNEINNSKENSFEQYVNLLLNENKSKEYPDINSFQD